MFKNSIKKLSCWLLGFLGFVALAVYLPAAMKLVAFKTQELLGVDWVLKLGYHTALICYLVLASAVIFKILQIFKVACYLREITKMPEAEKLDNFCKVWDFKEGSSILANKGYDSRDVFGSAFSLMALLLPVLFLIHGNIPNLSISALSSLLVLWFILHYISETADSLISDVNKNYDRLGVVIEQSKNEDKINKKSFLSKLNEFFLVVFLLLSAIGWGLLWKLGLEHSLI